jgi:hypothetical protein
LIGPKPRIVIGFPCAVPADVATAVALFAPLAELGVELDKLFELPHPASASADAATATPATVLMANLLIITPLSSADLAVRLDCHVPA